METKIIPFDAEIAKSIQDGKIKGKIKTRDGQDVRIICWDRKNENKKPIVALIDNGEIEVEYTFSKKGKWDFFSNTQYDLILEVPDNEIKNQQFKPFDKVLVRDNENNQWRPRFFDFFNGFYNTQDGKKWEYCIPYEGNEDLVGITNKLKED